MCDDGSGKRSFAARTLSKAKRNHTERRLKPNRRASRVTRGFFFACFLITGYGSIKKWHGYADAAGR